MPPEVLDLLAPIIILPTLGTMVLIGIKMRLNYLRDIRLGTTTEETRQLEEEVNNLRDEVLYLREGLDDMAERIEFHERLLTKAAEDEPRPPA